MLKKFTSFNSQLLIQIGPLKVPAVKNCGRNSLPNRTHIKENISEYY